MNKPIKAEYVLTEGKDILIVVVCPEPPNFRPSTTDLITDAEIEITDGIMTLKGNAVSFFYNSSDLSYEELKQTGKYVLDESLVTYPRFFKSLGSRYGSRWIEIKKTNPIVIISNAFRIYVRQSKGDTHEKTIDQC